MEQYILLNDKICYNQNVIDCLFLNILKREVLFMEKLMNVASYIYNRYYLTKGERIDEMKLHKMLYFAQREALIQRNEPLFAETFYGWKFGPVLKEIRNVYKDGSFIEEVEEGVIDRVKSIMDKVFEEYADKDSWSLSRLTHGEYSWKNARKEIPDGVNGDNPMDINDIAKDAERVRLRRVALAKLGLI